MDSETIIDLTGRSYRIFNQETFIDLIRQCDWLGFIILIMWIYNRIFDIIMFFKY